MEPSTPPKPSRLFGENYHLTLTQSMENLLAECRQETPNFSHFLDIFYELVQAKSDPPLESLWVMAALQFRNHNPAKEDLLYRLSIVKDLFQLVSAYSVSCSSMKSVALLAPVVFEVYSLLVDFLGKTSTLKREKKVMRELKFFIDVIVGYIGMSCSKYSNEDNSDVDTNLSIPVSDLISVWMGQNGDLQSFWPLISGEMDREISEGGCDVNNLAGVVILETFLLKLCSNIRHGIRGIELEKELKSWVVGSITGFQNLYFYESLARMLLEPTLPVTSLLSSDDAVLLRKILYDAVILVEYSFLKHDRVVQLSPESMKNLAFTRLIVTQEAIELFREEGDRKRAISYTKVFSTSQLRSQIIKWVINHAGMEENVSWSIGSSPKALLKWLLKLEDRGIKVFNDNIIKCHAELALDNAKADYEPPPSEVGGNKMDSDLFFYIDKKGKQVEEQEQEEDGDEKDSKINGFVSDAFVAAAHTMWLTENRGKKRKEKGSEEKKKKIKYKKYVLWDNSYSVNAKNSSVIKDNVGSESEIENPPIDEDAESDEQ